MKNKINSVLVVALGIAFSLLIGGFAFAQESIYVKDQVDALGQQKSVPGEIIVKFKPGVSDGRVSQINRGYGTTVLSKSLRGKFLRLRVPSNRSVEDMVATYNKNPNVEYAEPNFLVYGFFQPNDPYFPFQWHLDNNTFGGINMKSAWDIQKGSPGVIVAVVDTGVAFENYGKFLKAPDLVNTSFVSGYNFVSNTTHPNDDNSHGTHVTGTIAQSTNNGLGVAGIAFNTSIMPVKVLNKNGSGTSSAVADGIYFAADHGAKVINLSLGSSQDSTTIKNAMAYAYSKGVTSVCAAGNEYQSGNPPSYPAAYDAYCIAVGAARFDETRSYYSNTGSYLDIAAPGGDTSVDQNSDGYGDGVLQQTFNPNSKNPADFGYWFFQGTSMATPHVVGVAALLIAKGITGPDNVRAALQSTAEDKGTPGWDPQYGWGIVNALAALQYSSTTPIHDVAVTDLSVPAVNLQGESVSITVSVANQGTSQESFDVTVNDNTDVQQIGNQPVILPAGGTANLTFSWNTSSASLGGHNLSAEASPVTGETDLADNIMNATTTISEPIHDVAVVAVDVPLSVTQGNIIPIAVTVENQGTFTETTTVNLNDQTDTHLIGSQSVTFNAGGSTVVNFSWDTTGASLGTHDLKASASAVTGETDTLDNSLNVNVSVEAIPTSKVHISDIAMGISTRTAGVKNNFKRAKATVTVVDQNNAAVAGATVSGSWSGATSDSDVGVTDVSGKVTLESDEVKNPPSGTTYTFTANDVSKTGYNYDSGSNVRTSNSISIP